MAWQNPGAAGGAGAGGNGGGGEQQQGQNNGQAIGMEYTLQGQSQVEQIYYEKL
jgi:hypothetical protein